MPGARKKFRKFKKKNKGFRKKLNKNLFRFGITNATRQYTVEVTAFAVTTNTGLAVGNIAYGVAFNAPTYRSANTGAGSAYGQFGNVPTMWARLATMFDTYRVRALRVKFEPNAIQVVNPGLAFGTDAPNSVLMLEDPDDVGTNLTEAFYINQGVVAKSLQDGKPKEYIIRERKKDPWLNLNNVSIAPGSGSMTSSTVLTPTFYRSIKVLIPQVSVNEFPGRLYATWIVTVRGQQTTI